MTDRAVHRWDPHPADSMFTTGDRVWCPSCTTIEELWWGPRSTWELATALAIRRPVMRHVLRWLESRGEVVRDVTREEVDADGLVAVVQVWRLP